MLLVIFTSIKSANDTNLNVVAPVPDEVTWLPSKLIDDSAPLPVITNIVADATSVAILMTLFLNHAFPATLRTIGLDAATSPLK